MAGKRCFLGIKVTPFSNYENRLRSIIQDLDVHLKIVNPERYHLTIHFFGDIEDNEIQRIDTALGDYTFNAFKLKLSGTGIIPNDKPHRVRVLYVDTASGTEDLTQLVSEVQSILRGNGFHVKKKRFLPHLTIARVKRGKELDRLSGRWLELHLDDEQWLKVDQFSLIQSTLTSQGPIYNNLHTYVSST
ncbi:MAG: RNA 2',3'-cyclic phosphodiesterase [Candidatus Kariarchaeaceae archaeon]|jgi:2'-5' RNA ligase